MDTSITDIDRLTFVFAEIQMSHRTSSIDKARFGRPTIAVELR